MRFKKGDKVEVMNNTEVPISWCAAEILSGNSRNYNVKYDVHPDMRSEQAVEIVSRKFVRPRPPLIQGVESYNAGDIVEVFDEYSWKIAAILKIIGGKVVNKRIKIHPQYLVRLLGCSQELITDGQNIRMRQTWHDDKWIIMGKRSQEGDDVVATKPSTSNCYEKMNFQVPFNKRAKILPKKDCMKIRDESLKRSSPYGSSIVEAHYGLARKRLRATQNEGLVLEKVDAVAYPKETLGEKNMHASFNTLSNRYNNKKQNNEFLRSSELSTSDSDACSVGSCSVKSQNPKILHYREMDNLYSDAESSYVSGCDRKSLSLPRKEDLEVSIRRLELHAYRSTLGALYASGPLSWEQEALLTNLRIMLRISNDQHLMELKHLISTKNAISVR